MEKKKKKLYHIYTSRRNTTTTTTTSCLLRVFPRGLLVWQVRFHISHRSGEARIQTHGREEPAEDNEKK
jgi:hypothetical protein